MKQPNYQNVVPHGEGWYVYDGKYYVKIEKYVVGAIYLTNTDLWNIAVMAARQLKRG